MRKRGIKMQIYDWVSIGGLFVLGVLFYFRPGWLLGEEQQAADGAMLKVRTVSAAAVVCAMIMTVVCVIG